LTNLERGGSWTSLSKISSIIILSKDQT